MRCQQATEGRCISERLHQRYVLWRVASWDFLSSERIWTNLENQTIEPNPAADRRCGGDDDHKMMASKQFYHRGVALISAYQKHKPHLVIRRNSAFLNDKTGNLLKCGLMKPISQLRTCHSFIDGKRSNNQKSSHSSKASYVQLYTTQNTLLTTTSLVERNGCKCSVIDAHELCESNSPCL